ncbi:DEKNAAC101307 [Brettanomyces naardenensis]|uniref:DEKNAAC101307 n=1 Tax=Brettanomyces naardenensis TaxID=13370 RepID=A0A448YHT0_BRENA|nr:DEKNAAC101307 [Brettanomyces naardenensis]
MIADQVSLAYLFGACGIILTTYYLVQQLTIRHKASKEASRTPGKSSHRTDPNAPPPKPTPIYLTPEQVKNRDDRPWRPFRWPYHQTMSIFKLDINHWLDMDKYYYEYIKEKERVYHSYGPDNINWLPGSEDACLELMEMVKEHMLLRYPLLFTSEDNGIHVKNEITGETLDFSEPLKLDPLIYVSKMAKEDFYIVKKDDEGVHRLVAAAVPFPGGSFGIKFKLGKTLDVIHGHVPYYTTKLRPSMERWFGRMQPADLIERASWYISWDHKLLLNNVYALQAGDKVPSDVEPTDFNVRVERQTLRRLPKSKAIIFTNHPIFYSIEEMKDEPLVPSLIRKIIYEAPEGIIHYKNFESFRDHILPYLDSLVGRQVENGLIKRETPIRTLPSYPFAYFVNDSNEEKGWTNPSHPVDYRSKLQDEIKKGISMEEETFQRVSATAA